MKNEKKIILVLSFLFVLLIVLGIVRFLNKDKLNNQNVSIDNASNTNTNTNNIKEESKNQDVEEKNVFETIEPENISNSNNKGYVCITKYYRICEEDEDEHIRYDYDEKSDENREYKMCKKVKISDNYFYLSPTNYPKYLFDDGKDFFDKYYYTYYPVKNKNSCAYDVQEIKLNNSTDKFKVLKKTEYPDLDYLINESQFLAYLDNDVIKIYNFITKKSYNTNLSYKNYSRVIDIMSKDNNPIGITLELRNSNMDVYYSFSKNKVLYISKHLYIKDESIWNNDNYYFNPVDMEIAGKINCDNLEDSCDSFDIDEMNDCIYYSCVFEALSEKEKEKINFDKTVLPFYQNNIDYSKQYPKDSSEKDYTYEFVLKEINKKNYSYIIANNGVFIELYSFKIGKRNIISDLDDLSAINYIDVKEKNNEIIIELDIGGTDGPSFLQTYVYDLKGKLKRKKI